MALMALITLYICELNMSSTLMPVRLVHERFNSTGSF